MKKYSARRLERPHKQHLGSAAGRGLPAGAGRRPRPSDRAGWAPRAKRGTRGGGGPQTCPRSGRTVRRVKLPRRAGTDTGHLLGQGLCLAGDVGVPPSAFAECGRAPGRGAPPHHPLSRPRERERRQTDGGGSAGRGARPRALPGRPASRAAARRAGATSGRGRGAGRGRRLVSRRPTGASRPGVGSGGARGGEAAPGKAGVPGGTRSRSVVAAVEKGRGRAGRRRGRGGDGGEGPRSPGGRLHAVPGRGGGRKSARGV